MVIVLIVPAFSVAELIFPEFEILTVFTAPT